MTTQRSGGTKQDGLGRDGLERRISDVVAAVSKLDGVVSRLVDVQERQQNEVIALRNEQNRGNDWVGIGGLILVMVAGGVGFTMMMTNPIDEEVGYLRNEFRSEQQQRYERDILRARESGAAEARISMLEGMVRDIDGYGARLWARPYAEE